MKLSYLFALTVILSAITTNFASAEPMLTVTCDSPKGKRYDYGKGLLGHEKTKFQESADSFTDSNPIFVLDNNTPTELSVIWGDTKSIPKAMQRPTIAAQHPIVPFSKGQITAVNDYDNGVWVYSLFPKLGYAVFTRQSNWAEGQHATGSVLYAKCEFAFRNDGKSR